MSSLSLSHYSRIRAAEELQGQGPKLLSLQSRVETVQVRLRHGLQHPKSFAPARRRGAGADASIPSDAVGRQAMRHLIQQMQGLCPALPKAIGFQRYGAQLLVGR